MKWVRILVIEALIGLLSLNAIGEKDPNLSFLSEGTQAGLNALISEEVRHLTLMQDVPLLSITAGIESLKRPESNVLLRFSGIDVLTFRSMPTLIKIEKEE